MQMIQAITEVVFLFVCLYLCFNSSFHMFLVVILTLFYKFFQFYLLISKFIAAKQKEVKDLSNIYHRVVHSRGFLQPLLVFSSEPYIFIYVVQFVPLGIVSCSCSRNTGSMDITLGFLNQISPCNVKNL